MAAKVFARSGREPFRWVEIDQDFCRLDYGILPCTAKFDDFNKQCFNTRATCQAPMAYDRGVLTLRFCEAGAFIPRDFYVIPSLTGVQATSSKINPGGVNRSSGSIGTRASIALSFKDHPHSDRLVDKYASERPYDPSKQGTFWTKWRARNPYYLGRAIRYKTGYIVNGQIDYSTVVTQTYFITGFAGPDTGGSVAIQGQDVFSLIADEKAQAPRLSTGRLLADLDIDATTFRLDPIGIGDLEYPAAGKVRVGKEVMAYTRAGDVMTVARRQDGSEGNTAKAGDVVQWCLEFDAQRPDSILHTLVHEYGGIDELYLDTAQWAAEQTDFLPRLYSALITAPTGISTLIGEMSDEMYFYPWWDERSNVMKIRAVRPAENDVVYPINDRANIISGSMSIRDLPDQLITQVWVYYGLINAAGSLTDPNNFAAVRIRAALGEEGEDKQRQSRVKVVYSRWISALNAAAAEDLGDKLIARYSSIPREAEWVLDAKDRNIGLGDFVRVSDRLNVSDTGEVQHMNIQIFSVDEVKQGTHYRYRGQQFVFEDSVDPNVRLVPVAATIENYNLRAAHDEIYAPPVGGETVVCIVRAGAVIGGRPAADLEGYLGRLATSPQAGTYYPDQILMPVIFRDSTERNFVAAGSAVSYGDFTGKIMSDMWTIPPGFAFDTGDWPPGVTLKLLVEDGGIIVGQAGFGGYHLAHFEASNRPQRILNYCSDGGNALKIRHPISIENHGWIAPGAGGGLAVVNYNWRPSSPLVHGLFHLIAGGSGAGFFSKNAPPDESQTNLLRSWRASTTGSLKSPGGVAGFTDAYTGVFYYYAAGGDGGYFWGSGATGSGSLDGRWLTNDPNMVMLKPEAKRGLAGYLVSSGADMVTWTLKGQAFGEEKV